MRPGNQGALIRSRSSVRLTLAALIGALALLLAACGGDSGSELSATLRIHVGVIEVQPAGSDSFVAATDGQALFEGDLVYTTLGGRASIDWPDGSVTRLDFDTRFRVEELSGGTVLAPSTAIAATQQDGNTFSRVTELTETGDRFSVHTPTATAAVQGTEYFVLVGSDGSTTVVVTEGAVIVTSDSGEEVVVQAGQTVVVDADGEIGGPFPTPVDTLNDPWVRHNDACDASGGVCPTEVPGAFDRIEVVPADATINLGESQAYTAEGFDEDGESLGTVDASFSIDGQPCPEGVCTPAETGDFMVTAEFEEFSATGSLTVLATGDIQVTLDWTALVDLDLHVTDPDGETVWWQDPESASGGRLDRDGYADCTTDEPPPENIVWDLTAPSGDYQVTVVVWDMCDQASVDFELIVRIGGEVVLSETGTLTSDGETYETSFTKS